MDYFSKALGSLNIGLPFSVVDEPRISVNNREIQAAVWKKDSTLVSVLSYALKDPSDAAKGRNASAVLRRTRMPYVAKLIDSMETFEHQNIIVERVSLLDCAQLSEVAAKYVLHLVITALKTLQTVAQVSYHQFFTEITIGVNGLPLLLNFDQAQPEMAKSSPILTKDEFNSLISLVCAAHPPLQTKLRLANAPLNHKQLDLVLQTQLEDVVFELDRLVLLNPVELERACAQIGDCSEHLWPELVMGSVVPALIRTKSPLVLRTLLKVLANLPEIEEKLAKLQQHAAHEELLNYFADQYANLDRVIRLELLGGLPNYLKLLPAPFVQTKIMPKLAFGFVDSETLVRKASVGAVILLAEKLSSRQLNSELLRLLAKTHSDSNAEVRALTTGVLCRISPLLSNQGVVSTALGRALRDPSAKCRAAALQGVMDINLPPKEIAEKLLAPAASGMLDKDLQVSAEAWRVTDALLSQIQAAATASAPSAPQKTPGLLVDRIITDSLPKKINHIDSFSAPRSGLNSEPKPSEPKPNEPKPSEPKPSELKPNEPTMSSTNSMPKFGLMETAGASLTDADEDPVNVDDAWGWDENEDEPNDLATDDAWGWDE